MTFTERVKEEILIKKLAQPCCRVSALSAFIRGAGTLLLSNGHVGFEIVTENKKAYEYFSSIITSLYGIEPQMREFKDRLSGKIKYTTSLISDRSTEILVELGIISEGAGGIQFNLNVDKYLVEDECCKRAYIIGAFQGSGSVTIPSDEGKSSTSYHLEFVFSKYQTASCVAEILSELGFMPKLTDRKDSFIVYFKNGDEISQLLYFMGAKKCGFELQEIIVKKEMNNDTNRKRNCDMGNINKQIEASIKQVADITLIAETIGLDKLSKTLRETCELRLNNKDSSLEEMAQLSGLSKSCLNHRLRKISEIAKNL